MISIYIDNCLSTYRIHHRWLSIGYTRDDACIIVHLCATSSISFWMIRNVHSFKSFVGTARAISSPK